MKRFFAIAFLASALLASCADNYEYKEVKKAFGKLSFSGLQINVNDDVDVVRAATAADNNYLIYIYDSENTLYNGKPFTYGDILDGLKAEVSLPAGTYRLEARSAANLPTAEWEAPVYGVTKSDIVIEAGKTTEVGSLTCRLLQCKVTVDYNDDFLAMVAGDCKVDVTIGGTLTYEMSFDNGVPSYERRSGYFDVNNGANTTMEVKFSGSMLNEKTGAVSTQRMTKVFDNIAAAQWRLIKFIKKINEEGNVTFDIVINDFVEDSPLGEDVTGSEGYIGPDPTAPKGDGGIKLVCNEGPAADVIAAWNEAAQTSKPTIDLSTNSGISALKFTADVPNGVGEFYVDITSTNENFTGAVNAMSVNGDGRIYLTKTEDEHTAVITALNGINIAFPYPDQVINKTSVNFDLTNAISALQGFPGEHTFAMYVTDITGCKHQDTAGNAQPIKLAVVVNE